MLQCVPACGSECSRVVYVYVVRLCVSLSLARSPSLSLSLSLSPSLTLSLSLSLSFFVSLLLSLAHSQFCSDSRSTFVSFYFSDRVYLFTFISMCFVCMRLCSCSCIRACVCGCVYVYQKLKLKTVLNLSEHKYPTDSVEFLKEEAVIPHGVVCCSVQYHML